MAAVPAVDAPGVDRAVFADVQKWCREGKIDQLRVFLYFDPDAFNYFTVKTTRGSTLLHEAVEADQADVVQLLLLHGLSPDLKGKNGNTPLHIAASKGHVLCVEALLDGGADLSLTDDLGNNVLVKADRSKRRDVVLRLLKSKGKCFLCLIMMHCKHNVYNYYYYLQLGVL